MKYIYKLVYNKLYAGHPDQFGNPVFIDHCIGGNFLADEDPENPDTFLKLSPSDIIEKYKDRKHAQDLYMSNFVSSGDAVKTGYIGQWNDAIKDNAKIYYIMTDNGPCEMFIVKFNNLSFSNTNGVQYVTNIDGKMMDCYPEEGDILFDNEDEAWSYYDQVHKDVVKEKAKEEARKQIESMKAQYKKIPISELGDGTFMGWQSGNVFHFRGLEYESPIGIRQSFPKNVVIDIKDGKVSYRDWETSI